jgi:hypothetical protein
MKFIDINGDCVMYDEQGFPVKVLTVKNGIMYRISSQTQKTISVIVDPGVNGLFDTWLFFQEKTAPMACVQTRDIIPVLAEVYKEFIGKTEDYSIEDFISRVIADYFIGVLHYSLKPGLINAELSK